MERAEVDWGEAEGCFGLCCRGVDCAEAEICAEVG